MVRDMTVLIPSGVGRRPPTLLHKGHIFRWWLAEMRGERIFHTIDDIHRLVLHLRRRGGCSPNLSDISPRKVGFIISIQLALLLCSVSGIGVGVFDLWE
jgi:hypothetical protein